MPGIDHTTYILYRYLKELSVKISYGSIRQSLDTPMGNTLRGISDALDEFHIVHEVYQLPAEYLKELECPFISVIQNGQGKEKHCFSGVFPYNMERYRVDNRSVADSSARTLLQNKTDC